jgi:hypothetical protein
VLLARERDQRPARLRLHVRRVDDGETGARQAPARHLVQQRERVAGGGQVRLVVADERAEAVGGQHLRRPEMAPREGADEDDERQLGDRDLHRWNTAICVGGPTSGSTSPTGANVTT